MPGVVGLAGSEEDPRRITGALKFIFGIFGGGWKLAGRPLEAGRNPVEAPYQEQRWRQERHRMREAVHSQDLRKDCTP